MTPVERRIPCWSSRVRWTARWDSPCWQCSRWVSHLTRFSSAGTALSQGVWYSFPSRPGLTVTTITLTLTMLPRSRPRASSAWTGRQYLKVAKGCRRCGARRPGPPLAPAHVPSDDAASTSGPSRGMSACPPSSTAPRSQDHPRAHARVTPPLVLLGCWDYEHSLQNQQWSR